MADITVQYGNSTEEYDSPATLETAGKLMSNDLVLTATGGGGGSSTDSRIIYATCGDNFGSGYTLTINCESEVTLEDIKDGTILVCDFQDGVDSTLLQTSDGSPLTFDLCYNSQSLGLEYSQAYGYKNGHLTPYIYFENPTTAIFTYCAQDPQLPNVGYWELVGPNTADAMWTSYGVCYTPPFQSQKDAVLNDYDFNGPVVSNFLGGILISVNFYYPNTADNPTLNIEGDTARSICYGGWPITTGSEKYLLKGVCLFVLGDDYTGSLSWHLLSTDNSSNSTYRLEFETLEFYQQGQGGVWEDTGEMLWKIKDLTGLLTAIERGSTITMNTVKHHDASSTMDFTYDFNPVTQIQKWKSIYVGTNFSDYKPGSLVEDSPDSGTSHYLFEQTWQSSDIVDEYILEPEIIIFDWLGSGEIHIDPSTGLVLYNLNDWIGG